LYKLCISFVYALYKLMAEYDTKIQFYEVSSILESSRVYTGGFGADVIYKAAHFL
jgi:hypothetical protein